MKYLLTLTLIIMSPVLNSFAEESSESKPLVLPDFSGLRKTVTKPKVKVNMECTTTSGQKISSGSPDFDSCVADTAHQTREKLENSGSGTTTTWE